MATLPKEVAEYVGKAESGSFTALPPGPYVCKLRNVDTSKPPGSRGPYWLWEFEIEEGREHAGRRFWLSTSLSPQSAWKLKEVFDAFGYTTDSDTDEMIGERVKLIVGTEVQSQGANKGELRNVVQRVMEFDADNEDTGADLKETVAL